jgi:hypothetical protein
MPLGDGWWYDRRARRYFKITEHATCGVQHPRRFQSQAVAHLDPVADREVIVRHVAAQGFIRVRLWPIYRCRHHWFPSCVPMSSLCCLS